MQLRITVASPFCRKILAAVHHRRDELTILETAPSRDASDAGAQPVLLTHGGAFVTAGSILRELEATRPVLRPEGLAAAIDDLDRMLDLYLIEPVLHATLAPGSEAATSASHTARRALDLLEDRLDDGRRYLMGETLTFVDLTALIGVTDARRTGLSVPPRVEAYIDRLMQHRALGDIVEEAEAFAAMEEALAGAEAALAQVGAPAVTPANGAGGRVAA